MRGDRRHALERLSAAAANGAAVRMLGTGITLSAPLAAAHAQGAATRGLGTGIDFTPALSAPKP